MNKLKTLAAGVSLAFAVAPAMGGILSLEDNNIDFLLDSNLNPRVGATTINQGDVLLAILDFTEASEPGLIGQPPPPELTGVAAFQSASPDGATTFNFVPYDGGLNAVLAEFGGPNIGPSGDAGGGAMLAMWQDFDGPDLDISAAAITGGGFSCSTIEECVAQATDDTLFEVDGFGHPDDYWEAFSLTANPTTILNGATANQFGFFGAGLSVLEAGSSGATGERVLTGTRIDGTEVDVAVLLVGGLLGGGFNQWADTAQRDSLVDDGYTATSNTVLQKEVPAPATLALIGAGLLGFGASRRRRA